MVSTSRSRARSETLTPSGLPSHTTKRFSLPNLPPSQKPLLQSRLQNAFAASLPYVSERDADRQARACGQALPDLLLDWPRYGGGRKDDVVPDLPPVLSEAEIAPLLMHLDGLLRHERLRMSDCLNVDDVYSLVEESAPYTPLLPESRLWGTPLPQVLAYSSASTSQGVTHHDLPLVLYASIHQLYRSIHEPNLFRAPPSSSRLGELKRLFDTPHSFRFRTASLYPATCLQGERPADLCALLTSYLAALPEPIVPRAFWPALWTWCVAPTEAREAARAACCADEPRRSSAADAPWQRVRSPTLSNSSTRYCPSSTCPAAQDAYDLESHQIALAQTLLRLLPTAHARPLCYILAFLAQVEGYAENGFDSDAAARNFARPLFGAQKGARDALDWFVARWERIAPGLTAPLPLPPAAPPLHSPAFGMGAALPSPLWDAYSPAPGSPAFPLTPDDLAVDGHTYFSAPGSPAVGFGGCAWRQRGGPGAEDSDGARSGGFRAEVAWLDGSGAARRGTAGARAGAKWDGLFATPGGASVPGMGGEVWEGQERMAEGIGRRADLVAHGGVARAGTPDSEAGSIDGHIQEEDEGERSDETICGGMRAVYGASPGRTPTKTRMRPMYTQRWEEGLGIWSGEGEKQGTAWLESDDEEIVRRMRELRT